MLCWQTSGSSCGPNARAKLAGANRRRFNHAACLRNVGAASRDSRHDDADGFRREALRCSLSQNICGCDQRNREGAQRGRQKEPALPARLLDCSSGFDESLLVIVTWALTFEVAGCRIEVGMTIRFIQLAPGAHSFVQRNPRRRMIARFSTPAVFGVHVRVLQSRSGLRIEQQEVHAKTGVALKRVGVDPAAAGARSRR